MSTYYFQHPSKLFYVVLLEPFPFMSSMDRTENSKFLIPSCLFGGCFYIPCTGLSLLLCQKNAINAKILCAILVQGLCGTVSSAARALLLKAQ